MRDRLSTRQFATAEPLRIVESPAERPQIRELLLFEIEFRHAFGAEVIWVVTCRVLR